MDAIDHQAPVGMDAVLSKDAAETGGGWGADGAGPPSALAYDSEEERMKDLAPKTDAEVLMEQRKQKTQKMIANKKPGATLNPRKVQVIVCTAV